MIAGSKSKSLTRLTRESEAADVSRTALCARGEPKRSRSVRDVSRIESNPMRNVAPRLLIYTLVRSPEADHPSDNWVLKLGIRTTDGTVTDDKMSCEPHEFRSQATAVKWLREKAIDFGRCRRRSVRSVPKPLGGVVEHIR